MIIDTHCHYNLSPLHEEWQHHWRTAQAKGVLGSIVVGTSIETSKAALTLTQSEVGLFPTVGIHPVECQHLESLEDSIAQLQQLATSTKVLAIGECGLDYFRVPDTAECQELKASQQRLLRAQLELAQQTQLPLIIHLRDKTEQAYWDFLEVFTSVFSTPHPFILHCVSGPVEFVKRCVELGAYVGVAGNVTYPNSHLLRQVLNSIERERILVETDAPFLPPQAARGETCQPWMVQWTVEYLSKEYGLQESDLINHTLSLFPQFSQVYEAHRNS